MDIYDLTIIGGGPTGLYGAFYAGLRQMTTKIIDSLPELGGQLSALYPEKYIYDIGGFPKILAKDFVASAVEQGTQYGPVVCLNEGVEALERVGGDGPDGHWILTTNAGVHLTRALLIAGGVGSFSPRKVEIPGIDALEGRGVHYFITDPALFSGQRLVIVGGGDSAFDWSFALGPASASCVQVHRSDRFRAHEDTVAKVRDSGRVELKTFHELRSVHGGDRLEAVTLFDNRTGDETLLECDALLLNLGFLKNLGAIASWGLTLEKSQIVVDSTMRTNLPGVWAAGDICTFPGKLKLIATGIGEAATAANFAKTFLDPASKAFPGHSSDAK